MCLEKHATKQTNSNIFILKYYECKIILLNFFILNKDSSKTYSNVKNISIVSSNIGKIQ